MIPPISIDFEALNLASLVPMLVAIVGALTILCIDIAVKNLDKSLYIMIGILFLLVDLGLVYSYNAPAKGFFDIMYVDGLSILSQMIIIVATVLFMILGLSKLRFHDTSYPEYYALYLFVVAGFQFMVSSDSLIMIFVGLETASMAIYTMIAMHNRERAIEAAIKYFTMGALSSAFFAFGTMLFYAITGSVELGLISQSLVENNFDNYPIILLGVTFMVAALGFKLSLVPFHIWVADVYEGSTAAFAGFLSIVPKIAGFVVAIRFFQVFLSVENIWVEVILYVIVVLTMTIPNIIALIQTDLKRMLAFSSISHAGFAMAAVLIGTTQATTGLFFYWVLFLFTNLGGFAMIWMNREKHHIAEESTTTDIFVSDHALMKYSGLIKTSPFTAVMIGLFMLSLAGIPPFSIFWGKMFLLSSAINAGYIILAIIMAVNSAIAAYYYLKPIVFMFLKEPIKVDAVHMSNASTPIKVVVGFCAIFTILSIMFLSPIMDTISYFVQISGY